jgi:hypothetical protein
MRAGAITRAGVAVLLGSAALAGCADTSEPDRAAPTATLGNTRVSPGEFGRNVVRVGGLAPADVAGAAALATFSADDPPSGWVLSRDDDWRSAALAAQFAAGPVYAGLLSIDAGYLPAAAGDVLKRIQPRGFPKGDGLQALALGGASRELFGDVAERDVKLSLLEADTPDALALQSVPYRGGFAGAYSDAVVVVSSEARDYALPAAAWSAYSGDTLAFVGRDEIPAGTRELLVQREKLRLERPFIYVVGPSDVVSSAVVAGLRRYGPVKRIAEGSAVESAVALARYHDPQTGFGWGLRRGPASVSLVNRRDWGNATGAFSFAARGPQAPLLLLDTAGALPAPVEGYLAELARRGRGQAFAFGGPASIGSAVLSRVDDLLEGRGHA